MAEDIDPRAYLDTEARIIAENDVYAVIAVRVEKALIAHNLPLLAALSDLAPARRFIISAKTD
jgi:translation initiation factor RLI1